jgi:hypothetical protein
MSWLIRIIAQRLLMLAARRWTQRNRSLPPAIRALGLLALELL